MSISVDRHAEAIDAHRAIEAGRFRPVIRDIIGKVEPRIASAATNPRATIR
jgi:hypothetical protein